MCTVKSDMFNQNAKDTYLSPLQAKLQTWTWIWMWWKSQARSVELVTQAQTINWIFNHISFSYQMMTSLSGAAERANKAHGGPDLRVWPPIFWMVIQFRRSILHFARFFNHNYQSVKKIHVNFIRISAENCIPEYQPKKYTARPISAEKIKRCQRVKNAVVGSNRLDSRGAPTHHLGLASAKLSDVSASSPISGHQRLFIYLSI